MKKVGVARTYFLSGLESIKNMVDRGFPLKTIYDILQPPMAYHQLTYYARKYIGKTKGHSKEAVGKTKFSPGSNPAIENPSPPKAQPLSNPIEKQGGKDPHFPPGSSLSDDSKTIGKEEESPQVKPFESFEKFDYNPVPPKKEDVW